MAAETTPRRRNLIGAEVILRREFCVLADLESRGEFRLAEQIAEALFASDEAREVLERVGRRTIRDSQVKIDHRPFSRGPRGLMEREGRKICEAAFARRMEQ